MFLTNKLILKLFRKRINFHVVGQKAMNLQLNPFNKYFLYGIRKSFFIMNFEEFVFNFRIALFFLIRLIALRGKVIAVDSREFLRSCIIYFFLKSKHFYQINKWIGGTLSNFKFFRSFYIFIYKKKMPFLKYFSLVKYFHGMISMKQLPNLLICTNIDEQITVIQESFRVGITTCGTISPFSSNFSITFPIIYNFEEKPTIVFFYQIIKNALFLGLFKEIFIFFKNFFERLKKIRKHYFFISNISLKNSINLFSEFYQKTYLNGFTALLNFDNQKKSDFLKNFIFANLQTKIIKLGARKLEISYLNEFTNLLLFDDLFKLRFFVSSKLKNFDINFLKLNLKLFKNFFNNFINKNLFIKRFSLIFRFKKFFGFLQYLKKNFKYKNKNLKKCKNYKLKKLILLIFLTYNLKFEYSSTIKNFYIFLNKYINRNIFYFKNNQYFFSKSLFNFITYSYKNSILNILFKKQIFLNFDLSFFKSFKLRNKNLKKKYFISQRIFDIFSNFFINVLKIKLSNKFEKFINLPSLFDNNLLLSKNFFFYYKFIILFKKFNKILLHNKIFVSEAILKKIKFLEFKILDNFIFNNYKFFFNLNKQKTIIKIFQKLKKKLNRQIRKKKFFKRAFFVKKRKLIRKFIKKKKKDLRIVNKILKKRKKNFFLINLIRKKKKFLLKKKKNLFVKLIIKIKKKKIKKKKKLIRQINEKFIKNYLILLVKKKILFKKKKIEQIKINKVKLKKNVKQIYKLKKKRKKNKKIDFIFKKKKFYKFIKKYQKIKKYKKLKKKNLEFFSKYKFLNQKTKIKKLYKFQNKIKKLFKKRLRMMLMRDEYKEVIFTQRTLFFKMVNPIVEKKQLKKLLYKAIIFTRSNKYLKETFYKLYDHIVLYKYSLKSVSFFKNFFTYLFQSNNNLFKLNFFYFLRKNNQFNEFLFFFKKYSNNFQFFQPIQSALTKKIKKIKNEYLHLYTKYPFDSNYIRETLLNTSAFNKKTQVSFNKKTLTHFKIAKKNLKKRRKKLKKFDPLGLKFNIEIEDDPNNFKNDPYKRLNASLRKKMKKVLVLKKNSRKDIKKLLVGWFQKKLIKNDNNYNNMNKFFNIVKQKLFSNQLFFYKNMIKKIKLYSFRFWKKSSGYWFLTRYKRFLRSSRPYVRKRKVKRLLRTTKRRLKAKFFFPKKTIFRTKINYLLKKNNNIKKFDKSILKIKNKLYNLTKNLRIRLLFNSYKFKLKKKKKFILFSYSNILNLNKIYKNSKKNWKVIYFKIFPKKYFLNLFSLFQFKNNFKRKVKLKRNLKKYFKNWYRLTQKIPNFFKKQRVYTRRIEKKINKLKKIYKKKKRIYKLKKKNKKKIYKLKKKKNIKNVKRKKKNKYVRKFKKKFNNNFNNKNNINHNINRTFDKRETRNLSRGLNFPKKLDLKGQILMDKRVGIFQQRKHIYIAIIKKKKKKSFKKN